MKNRKIKVLLALVVMGIMVLSGCKKQVGTPEDNPVQEDGKSLFYYAGKCNP